MWFVLTLNNRFSRFQLQLPLVLLLISLLIVATLVCLSPELSRFRFRSLSCLDFE